jgi:exodeoxyribonuclease VII small subunit
MSSESESTAIAVEDLSFEEAFSELDGTVQRLEEGEMALEEAIALYEWGMALARRCGDALDAAELKVQQLTVINDQQQMGMFFEDEED